MAKKLNSGIKIEELLPNEYLTLTEYDKKIVCLASIKAMVDMLVYSFGKDYTQPDNIKNILQLTITQYEKNESYETCAILYDMLTMIDEL
jgi:hypothetical protein